MPNRPLIVVHMSSDPLAANLLEYGSFCVGRDITVQDKYAFHFCFGIMLHRNSRNTVRGLNVSWCDVHTSQDFTGIVLAGNAAQSGTEQIGINKHGFLLSESHALLACRWC